MDIEDNREKMSNNLLLGKKGIGGKKPLAYPVKKA